jgi:hypothetical protein
MHQHSLNEKGAEQEAAFTERALSVRWLENYFACVMQYYLQLLSYHHLHVSQAS